MADNEKLDKAQAPSKPSPKKDRPEKKSDKDKKPTVLARIKQWVKETRAELKKVQWPTWKQTLNNTLVVVGVCIVVGLCIFAFDKVAGLLLDALISLTHGAA